MFGKTAVTVILLFLVMTGRAFALGLGDIDLRSSLSQPLDAVVELNSATAGELEELEVSIAAREAFDRAGIGWTAILNDLSFSVERTEPGRPIIHITSQKPVQEPFLEFLLEVAWSKGRLVRTYTVLVDPPVTMPATPVVPVAPVTPRAEAGSASPRPVEQRQQARPQAAATAASPPSTPIEGGRADQYGPVRRGDTLWVVARKVRPASDLSIDQTMIALQRANPHAFINNNINNLKAGVVLSIPGRDEISSLGITAAHSETQRQYAEWQAARNAREEPVPAAPAAETQATPAAETRLQLLAPEGDAFESAVTPGAPDAGAETEASDAVELRQQLALATEEAEAGQAQSEELQSRVSELEEQIADMQRLLELKDTELANLQKTLAEEAAAVQALEEAAPAGTKATEQRGLIDKVVENPVLAGLLVLAAMLLGGFLWASARQKSEKSIFSDELTLEKRLAADEGGRAAPEKPRVKLGNRAVLANLDADDTGPLSGREEYDPLAEADVFIAYGRPQQAEMVIKEALEDAPDDNAFKVKLMEIYHTAGDATSFDAQAQDFRASVAGDDPMWEKVASMGRELSPRNSLYTGTEGDQATDDSADFDMDLSGMDDMVQQGEPGSKTQGETLGFDTGEDRFSEDSSDDLEFGVDEESVETGVEDASEGLLEDTDEINTKLGLAHTYIDMGDPEGARGILEEVLQEGDDAQRSEAEALLSKLA